MWVSKMTQICGFDGRGCDNCLQQRDIDPKFARSGENKQENNGGRWRICGFLKCDRFCERTNKKTMVEEEGFVDS